MDLSNGTVLATGDAALGNAAITLDSGASWVNGGAATYSAAYPDPAFWDGPNIAVHGGASVVTNGVQVLGGNSGADGIDLTIDGLGTSWWDNGTLHLSGSSLSSVLNGATARDDGVVIEPAGYATRAIVDGAGSAWDAGSLTWNASLAEQHPGVFITDGGRVTSSSLLVGNSESLVSFGAPRARRRSVRQRGPQALGGRVPSGLLRCEGWRPKIPGAPGRSKPSCRSSGST